MAEAETETSRRLGEELAGRVARGESLENVLDEILHHVGGRATGLWVREGDVLRCRGFRAVADMPADVQEGFQEATRTLPLERTDLGVVKAAVSGEPTAARLSGEAGLSGSASWLERFEASSSLAVPIFDGERVAAVLAVSSAEVLEPERGGGARLMDVAGAVRL